MKTLVYQSFRTTGVPPWITACMQTVQHWAAANAFDYQFVDDRLFDLVPAWYRQKAQGQICPISDLARLILAREFLQQGYERTVWVDADMVVFAPERFTLDIGGDFAFCHEVWMEQDESGKMLCNHRINNSVTVFNGNSPPLDFFIDSCLRIARNKPLLGKLEISTLFLSGLRNLLPFPLLPNIGTFSPAIVADIARETGQHLPQYMQHMTAPLAAANLCSSLSDDAALYQTAVEVCLRTRGEIINRHFTGSNPRLSDLVHAGRL